MFGQQLPPLQARPSCASSSGGGGSCAGETYYPVPGYKHFCPHTHPRRFLFSTAIISFSAGSVEFLLRPAEGRAGLFTISDMTLATRSLPRHFALSPSLSLAELAILHVGWA